MNTTTTTAAVSGSPDRTLAIVAHIGGLLTSWLAPLVIYLIKKSDPAFPFATEQAKEALNFQITMFIGYMIGFVLSLILIGVFLIFAVMLVNLPPA